MVEIMEKQAKLKNQNKNVIFVWVKGHSDVRGNIIADKLAKSSSLEGDLIDNLPYSDIIPVVRQNMKMWEEESIVTTIHTVKLTIRYLVHPWLIKVIQIET